MIKNFFNITNVINKNQDFAIIGCQYSQDKVFMPAGFFNKKNNNKFINRFKNETYKEIEK